MKIKTLLIWVLLAVLCIVVFQLLSSDSDSPKEISASQFMEMAKKGQIAKAEFIGDQVVGTLKQEAGHESTKPERVVALVTYTGESLAKTLSDSGVMYTERRPPDTGWIWIVFMFAAMLAVLFLLPRMLKRDGPNSIMGSIGKHKGVEVSRNIRVRFSDMAGADEAKLEVSEIVDYLKDPLSFSRLGAKAPKGVLLMGPPGTGKTLLARAMAGEAGVSFIETSGSEFVEMFVGVGAARVRSLFEEAKKSSPCIIFIDEIDAVGRQRGGGARGNSHDEREQTLNQILTEMDGFEDNGGVIVIAATNRPDILDQALLRPGRFDRKVTIPRPDVKGRLAILKIHSKGKTLADDVDFEALAKTTTNMSGADLEYVMNEAATLAVRANADAIAMEHLEDARDKSVMGAEQRSRVLSEQVKTTIAWHEAGHAVVGHFLKWCDPVQRVSIVPRGQALGITMFRPEEDTVLRSKAELLATMQALMGGRMAELLAFGEDRVTTGASNDLQRATSIASAMVKEYGMSDLGLRSFVSREEGFIYDTLQRDFGDNAARQIDSTVDKLVIEAATGARLLLEQHREQLDGLATILLQQETVDAKTLREILGPRPVA